MISNHHIARERDAAFFEDWSPWASLDGLEGRQSHYYCLLRKRVAWMDRYPCFEIAIPEQEPIARLLRAVPGSRKHPPVKFRRIGFGPGPDTVYCVPAEHWRALRQTLPEIKTAVRKWMTER